MIKYIMYMYILFSESSESSSHLRIFMSFPRDFTVSGSVVQEGCIECDEANPIVAKQVELMKQYFPGEKLLGGWERTLSDLVDVKIKMSLSLYIKYKMT